MAAASAGQRLRSEKKKDFVGLKEESQVEGACEEISEMVLGVFGGKMADWSATCGF